MASNSGPLGERKGINLPGAALTLPAVSPKDKADLAFGVEQGIDLIFASFVRKGAHVDELRDVLGAMLALTTHQGTSGIILMSRLLFAAS